VSISIKCILHFIDVIAAKIIVLNVVLIRKIGKRHIFQNGTIHPATVLVISVQ